MCVIITLFDSMQLCAVHHCLLDTLLSVTCMSS